MTVQNWSPCVNQMFFNFHMLPVDDSVTKEFASGRTIVMRKNTKMMHSVKCTVAVSLPDEYNEFYRWFEDMGGLSGLFTCDALPGKVFRFEEIPEDDGDSMVSRNINLSFVEVG